MPRKKPKFDNDFTNLNIFQELNKKEVDYVYFKTFFSTDNSNQNGIFFNTPYSKIFSTQFQCKQERSFEISNKDQFYLIVVVEPIPEWYLLIYDENKNGKTFNISTDHGFNYLQLFNCNFATQKKYLTNVIWENNKIQLDIYINSLIIIDEYSFFETNYLNCDYSILPLMAFIFNYENSKEVEDNFKYADIKPFYAMINQKQSEVDIFNRIDSQELNVTELDAKLWRHQELAVKWMMYRENNDIRYSLDIFQSCWIKFDEIYYNKLFGHFLTKDVYEQYLEKHNFFSSKGGILADQMGYGKTLNMLALILKNKTKSTEINSFVNESNLFCNTETPLSGTLQCYCGKKMEPIKETIDLETLQNIILEKKYFIRDDDLIKCAFCANYQHVVCCSYDIDDGIPYVCGRCFFIREPIDSAATLIVCPKALLEQWADEIFKYTGLRNIKAIDYSGVKARDYKSALKLASYDIVITTYDVLKYELNYIEQIRTNLRNAKRYHFPISPLISINWWRLCFDEAQVFGGSNQTFKMASTLSAVNRWAVTGTPIQKDIADLYYLLNFIREKPFCYDIVWKKFLYFPFLRGQTQNMATVVSNFFWRMKEDYLFENNLMDKPIINIQFINFRQVEIDNYMHHLKKLQIKVEDKIINMSKKMTFEWTDSVRLQMLQTLLGLRQLCCFPHTYESKELSLNNALKDLINETKSDSERVHRERIMWINGFVGFLINGNNIKAAIDCYKESLAIINEFNNNYGIALKTDATQLYHILLNLSILVEHCGFAQWDENNVPYPPIDDPKLIIGQPLRRKEAKQLSFSDEDRYYRSRAMGIRKLFSQYAVEKCNISNRNRLKAEQKCDSLEKNLTQWFVYALKKLVHLIPILSEISDRVENRPVDFFIYLFIDYYEKFSIYRSKIKELFESIDYTSPVEDLAKYIDCHVDKTNKQVPVCTHCKLKLELRQYEVHLYSTPKDFPENYVLDWSDNKNIVSLRRILEAFKRRCHIYDDYKATVDAGNLFFNYFDECKKEFLLSRKHWKVLEDFILKMDELKQASQRIPYSDNQHYFEINPEIDLIESHKHTNTHLRKLSYLINLEKKMIEKDSDVTVCSVCWNDLVDYFLINCGHVVCSYCLTKIQLFNSLCPICRFKFSEKDCTLISDKNNHIRVDGNWSAKFNAIIRCIKNILKNKEKILIFCSWNNTLKSFEKALEKNDIWSETITDSSKDFYEKLINFKSSRTIHVLLLNTHFASKGLNITEASHIIFINSTLYKNDELQAIGRICRIGQTKKTYVHKFIVKNTIEEVIENLPNSDFQESKMTFREFINLLNFSVDKKRQQ